MVVCLVAFIALCMTANALRLRARLRGLHPLPPASGGAPAGEGEYVLLTADGVEIPPGVLLAAERHARGNGLGMLDLMPRDLHVDAALDLARHLDFDAYREDIYGMGRGACHAVLASRTAAARAGITAVTGLGPDELGAATARLRLHTGTADIVVAPFGARDQAAFRRSRMRSLALVIPQTLAMPQTLFAAAGGYLLVAGAVALAPAAGLALALLYCALPALAFYYKDVYDGLGDVLAERILSSNTSWYLARAAMAARATSPETWLDIGTGKGHFCRVARGVLPGTRFDGLDIGAAVEEGAQRGWIDRAYRGEFTALAADLAGRYDVISMHHYLEHTADPLGELDTVVKVLPSGGHLLIELPDPESWFGRVLRGFWVPWLAPQHLHMIPIGNLREALEQRGLEILAEERREADQGPDFVASVAAVVNRLGLDVDRPWWPRPPGRREYIGTIATIILAGPLMGTAVLLDLLTTPIARRSSNAYRVLARKNLG
ncbi:class I SAM-dependent methyltransferase [Actinomadura sp. KC345]|uniref:class I SAM-dependent methyltransferase n=1 Tax=Actinomadura sp. KC345 TaxID=2530371 RepID=UPI00104C8F09|nr:class I SAM-dependent methyltransferase [Actinomadura sp. KC345]TDC48901.1 class I SAM-dependent methyltransferase [Actinomadura sp. KC345]